METLLCAYPVEAERLVGSVGDEDVEGAASDGCHGIRCFLRAVSTGSLPSSPSLLQTTNLKRSGVSKIAMDKMEILSIKHATDSSFFRRFRIPHNANNDVRGIRRQLLDKGILRPCELPDWASRCRGSLTPMPREAPMTAYEGIARIGCPLRVVADFANGVDLGVCAAAGRKLNARELTVMPILMKLRS